MANALILVVDGLGCSCLGPYGNTWIDTPAWNRLAARSLLFETMLADSGELASIYNGYWHGTHRLQAPVIEAMPTLPGLVGQQAATILVTDDRELGDTRGAQDFEQRVVLPTETMPVEAASELEQTELARLFASALTTLEQAAAPFLLWIHARGLCGPWDAPYALRAGFAAEDDPAPPAFVRPPAFRLEPDYDPDTVLGLQQAHAAQVATLDTCLDVLLDAFWSGPYADDTLLVVLGSRGYPLGEHHWVGVDAAPLYAELLQVPALIHWPDGRGSADRMPHLIQPCDVMPTVLRWLDVPLPENGIWGRDLTALVSQSADELGVWDRAVAGNGAERVIRVPGWCARLCDHSPPELYVKPDDRWEVNNVADRCHDVVDQLRDIASQFEQAARENRRDNLVSLPEPLFEDWA